MACAINCNTGNGLQRMELYPPMWGGDGGGGGVLAEGLLSKDEVEGKTSRKPQDCGVKGDGGVTKN